MHGHIGARRGRAGPVRRRNVLLLGEIGVLEHARRLDDAPQFHLAPGSPRGDGRQGGAQRRRLPGEFPVSRSRRRKLLAHSRILRSLLGLHGCDPLGHVFEPCGQRFDHPQERLFVSGPLGELDVFAFEHVRSAGRFGCRRLPSCGVRLDQPELRPVMRGVLIVLTARSVQRNIVAEAESRSENGKKEKHEEQCWNLHESIIARVSDAFRPIVSASGQTPARRRPRTARRHGRAQSNGSLPPGWSNGACATHPLDTIGA